MNFWRHGLQIYYHNMKQNSFLSLFPVPKPILGMVHLGLLAGQAGFRSEKDVVTPANRDIHSWQQGGIHGLVIENWMEDSIGPCVTKERADSMLRVIRRLRPSIHVPFGVNVLNNDYESAYRIAAETGASFIQVDVLVDKVISDFIYNDLAKDYPFIIDVSLPHMRAVASTYGLSKLPVLAGIHPKHYRMIDQHKTLTQSVRESKRAGVAGIVITKSTGIAPFAGTVTRVAKTVDIPVGVGSGLTPESAPSLLTCADFAIVGTFAKQGGVTDKPVDTHRVKTLMNVVYDIAKTKV